MHWFHFIYRVDWLVILWIASFFFFLAAFWLMTRPVRTGGARRVKPHELRPHPPGTPKPSM